MLKTRILHGRRDKLTMWRDFCGQLYSCGHIARDNYALESWERMHFGGVRVVQ